jgi:hypothetical protein
VVLINNEQLMGSWLHPWLVGKLLAPDEKSHSA